MNEMSKYKNPLLYVLAAILGVIALFAVWPYFTPIEKMPLDLQAKIDSLNDANQKLLHQQQKIDSAISSYQSKIRDVGLKINQVKEKATFIDQYHREVNHRLDIIPSSQLDSFFKNRYHY